MHTSQLPEDTISEYAFHTAILRKHAPKKRACFTSGGEGLMAKDCPSKKDKGKAKVKKEATSNLATELSKYDEVYINTLEIESSAAAKMTHLTPSKGDHTLEGIMLINGKEAKVLFDTGTMEANLISAALVTTQGIPCIKMKEPTKILMIMKGAPSESHQEWTVDLAVGKRKTQGSTMLVGYLAKYDALIGMQFLKEQGAIIQ